MLKDRIAIRYPRTQFDISTLHSSRSVDIWTILKRAEKGNYLTVSDSDAKGYKSPGSGQKEVSTQPRESYGTIERYMFDLDT